MSFSYKPKTEAEISAMNLLPDGDYPFSIRDASDAPSKSTGKAMLTLHLLCYTPTGGTVEVLDRIVPGSNYADKKLFELCRAIGLLPRYQAGTLSADDFLNKEGWAKITTEAGKPKDPNDASKGTFFDKNKVGWYLKGPPESKGSPAGTGKPQPTERELANLPPAGAKLDDSDIPF